MSFVLKNGLNHQANLHFPKCNVCNQSFIIDVVTNIITRKEKGKHAKRPFDKMSHIVNKRKTNLLEHSRYFLPFPKIKKREGLCINATGV